MNDELTSRDRDLLAGWTIVEPPAGFAERVVRTHARRQLVRRSVVASAAVTLAAAAAVMLVILSRPPAAPQPSSPQVYIPPPQPQPQPQPLPQPQPPPPRPHPQPPTVVATGIVSIPMGESASIHDTAVGPRFQITNDGRCPGTIIAELDQNPRFHNPQKASGTAAVFEPAYGSYAYRVRCSEGEPVAATGRVRIVRDGAMRPLPKRPPKNSIGVDGRTYRVSFHSVEPSFTFTTKRPGTAYKLHITGPGFLRTLESTGPAIDVPPLGPEGPLNVVFEVDGVKDDRATTLIIDFDQTAPQLMLASPPDGKAWPATVDAHGEALPGWSLTIDNAPVPIATTGQFAAKITRPRLFVLRAAHPQRGVHYYVRHPK